MKKISLICTALALSMLVSCSSGAAGKKEETTTQNTDTPAPHLHFDSGEYPSSIDFSDTEAIETIFDMCEITDSVKVTVIAKRQCIKLSGPVNGKKFTLTIDLSGAEGNTSPEQIVTCAKLFWYCYPQMYARFAHSKTPVTVLLKFENFGYEVASASGSEVHIHDMWLKNNPQDFDCLTHEFSHIIQGGWDGNYVPSYGDDTYMIERFADYCRYLYSFKRGEYNDLAWTLQTASTENTYYSSVRFWVWLDYTYSTAEIDIMNRIAQAVVKKDKNFTAAHWESDGDAWQSVFEGTGAQGKNIDQLWDEFADSEMASLSSNPRRPGSTPPLVSAFPLRQAIRDRYPESDDYLKVR